MNYSHDIKKWPGQNSRVKFESITSIQGTHEQSAILANKYVVYIYTPIT